MLALLTRYKYMHTLCFELILDLVHVPFMMLDANGSIPHTQAQQHHSWATRNTFVIVTAIAIVTAVVIIMLSVTCIKHANLFKGF